MWSSQFDLSEFPSEEMLANRCFFFTFASLNIFLSIFVKNSGEKRKRLSPRHGRDDFEEQVPPSSQKITEIPQSSFTTHTHTQKCTSALTPLTIHLFQRRRTRQNLSKEVVDILEAQYQQCPYVSQENCKQILSEKTGTCVLRERERERERET